jgi:hypothetical protein
MHCGALQVTKQIVVGHSELNVESKAGVECPESKFKEQVAVEVANNTRNQITQLFGATLTGEFAFVTSDVTLH